MSGLAREFETKGLGRYCAGLWSKYIGRMLLWMPTYKSVYYDHYRNNRPSQYTAPTWSWASTKHGVEFVGNFREIEDDDNQSSQMAGLRLAGQVIDVNCQAAGLDATGAVSGASLILQTHVIDGLLMVVPPVDPEQAVDPYMFIVINTLNNSLCRFYPDSMAELDLLTVRHSVTCVLWAIDEPRGPLLGKGAACSYGFVLRRGRGEREIYQRLGLLEMWQYGPEAQERMQPLDFEQFFHGATVRTLEIV